MKKRISRHEHPGDPYWHLLRRGLEMTGTKSGTERLSTFFRMQREHRLIFGESEVEKELKEKRILIHEAEWFDQV